MSKPSSKKKRTILDFFTKPGQGTSNEPVSKKRKTMASNYGSDEVTDKEDKTALIKDQPGTSETCKIENSDSELETAEEEDSQKSDVSSASDRIPIKKPSQIKDGSNAWKGIPLKMLDTLGNTSKHKDHLEGNREHHRVLFKTPWQYDGKTPPKPYPSYRDKWDHNHVRLPCSNLNEYPVNDKNGKPLLRRRWDMIQEELIKDIPGPYELEERILTYNSRYFGKWRFTVLHDFFRVYVTEDERDHFFNKVIKGMACLALQLPLFCSAPIPLLRARHNFSLTFSQQQIACLLANAFFCTFPCRNAKGKSEYANYPNINFNTLFSGPSSPVKFEKLKCIFNYFKRVCNQTPCGTVTFTRQHIDSSKLPNWETDDTHLTALHVSSEGTIEDDGFGLLQVDFANKFLGGGVLGHGCVQEEIRFLICPEMIISRLITESLGEEECLIMRGCERFSNYEGYASKFEWKDNYDDKTPRDSWGRMQCEVTAIDALVFHDYKTQFYPSRIKRELNKAYCGFFHPGKRDNLPAVCTGNWGCGAFGGDKQLKSIIQMMAAAKARRDVCYFTFDDEKLRDDLHCIHKLLTDMSLDIGKTWSLIYYYYMDIVSRSFKVPEITFFEFIQNSDISALKPNIRQQGSSSSSRHHSFSHSQNQYQPWSTGHSGSAIGKNMTGSYSFDYNSTGKHNTHTTSGGRNKNLFPRMKNEGGTMQHEAGKHEKHISKSEDTENLNF